MLAEGVVVDPEQFRTESLRLVVVRGMRQGVDRCGADRRPALPPGTLWSRRRRCWVCPGGWARHSTPSTAPAGLHAAAAFTPDGELLDIAEDVGRHNAVDKLVGRLAGDRWPIGDLVMAVSGRVGYEIAQKAAVAGIPVVAGISAASSLAAELGEELGLTIVGFVRPGMALWSTATRSASSARFSRRPASGSNLAAPVLPFLG